MFKKKLLICFLVNVLTSNSEVLLNEYQLVNYTLNVKTIQTIG
jgi:hypothetical protein